MKRRRWNQNPVMSWWRQPRLFSFLDVKHCNSLSDAAIVCLTLFISPKPICFQTVWNEKINKQLNVNHSPVRLVCHHSGRPAHERVQGLSIPGCEHKMGGGLTLCSHLDSCRTQTLPRDTKGSQWVWCGWGWGPCLNTPQVLPNTCS